MKRIEITYNAYANEMIKLTAKLERVEKAYAKKLATAEKMGVANWDNEQHREWLATVPTNNGWIISKDDIKKNGAWFDLYSAERELEDVKERIENATKRMEKAEKERDAYYEELEQVADLKRKEELFKLEFEQEQKEWKKDGITLEGRYYGETPQGKRFWVYGNSGFTTRSLHCYTLRIDGETVFTSGEFWRAYGIIKES